MNQEIAVRPAGVVVHEMAYSDEQLATLHRLVRVRPGQKLPEPAEMALMIQEASHLDLDPFAGECYFINLGDGWITYPHWSGLLKKAEATGEYEGHDGPVYSDDGEHWTEAWVKPVPPVVCKVTVYRRGHRPTVVVVKHSRVARDTPPWKKDPEGMMGKTALRLAWRRAFPTQVDRPLSPAQLKALHTLAALEGLGGDANRDRRLEAASEIVGRPVESFRDLSVAEASEVFEEWAESNPPAGDKGREMSGEEVVAATEVDEAEAAGEAWGSGTPAAIGWTARLARTPQAEPVEEVEAEPVADTRTTLETLLAAYERVHAQRPKIAEGWLVSWLVNEEMDSEGALEGEGWRSAMAPATEDQAQRGLDWLRAIAPKLAY